MDVPVDFTREPIIETVITPKEGCKLVVRSSKSNGQEEHFVDAVEVVSFGHSFFFRSLERPKTFLVPATDYEILEVREARMVLKNVGIDRAIKIGGGRDGQMRSQREPRREEQPERTAAPSGEGSLDEGEEGQAPAGGEKPQEGRGDKKRERRRKYRSRRGREGGDEEQEGEGAGAARPESPEGRSEGETPPLVQQAMTTSILTSLLPPPPTLISETIARYKDNVLFKDAFYTKDESKSSGEAQEFGDKPTIPLDQPEYGTFEVSEEEEEEIYQQRKKQGQQTEESNQHHQEGGEHKEFPFDDSHTST